MKLLANLLSPIRPRAQIDIVNDVIMGSGYGPTALTGVHVTPDSAMRLSAVFACVRLISNSLASIPLITYKRRSDGGRDRARGMPLYDLLHDRPNRYMTAFEFKRLLTVWALLRGRGCAYIRPGPRGAIDHLDPIHPDLVESVELASDDTLRYSIRQPDGKAQWFVDDEIFDLRGLSLDGVNPVSVVEYARESMGLALATEQYGATHFSQSSVPAAVLVHPGKLSTSGRKKMRDEWEADVSGLVNAHRTAVLAEGVDVKTLAMSNDDSQFLQTREFQVADIARWFGVPLHMIQEVSGSTSWGSGLEQMSQGFVTFTLLPWAMLWEETISRDLILAEQTYFSEFLFDALVRADFKTRYETYDIALKDQIMSRNEVRERENLNPVEGGDFGDEPPAPVTSQPEPAQPPDDGQQDDSAGAHYKKLVVEAASRVIRKEQAALSKAFQRVGSNKAAWRLAIKEFCDGHEAYVEQTMCMNHADVIYYVDGLRQCGDEPPSEEWDQQRLSLLIRLAEERV